MTSIAGISRSGLQKSSDGRLGGGVYFVESYEEAKSIASHRGNGSVTAVFECNVRLGKLADLKKSNNSNWQSQYNSAKAVHPPWAGIEKDFIEFCLLDDKYCSVKKVWLISGDLEGCNVTRNLLSVKTARGGRR